MQIVCVLIPHFIAQMECQRRPSLKGRPMIIAHSLGSRRTVLDYSSEVVAVHGGMVLQQAIARAGAATILQADLPLYEEAFDRMLDSLEQVSPAVEGESLGCTYVDLDGLERLYGGLPAVLV